MAEDVCEFCPKGFVSKRLLGVTGVRDGKVDGRTFCEKHWNIVRKGGLMALSKPTHVRLRTGSKVIVSREYDVVIVRSLKGKVLGSYAKKDMGTFNQRYKSLNAG